MQTNNDIWTVRRILEWIEGYLAERGDGNARLSSQWLVSEALGVSRMQLFMDMERPLTAEERATLRDWTRRRATGEPLQYITGTTDFRHIQVKVRAGVLIPRPETEVLVSEALALLPAPSKPQEELEDMLVFTAERMRETGESFEEASGKFERHAAKELLVADICTGSGCIACSIAFEHPGTRVVATDLSPDAVALARENAAALGLEERVDVVECDLAGGIEPSLVGTFALVVSNPPYVPSAELADIPHEVAAFEPTLALDGGADGLDVFRRLINWCGSALMPGGGFAFELHETCLDAAADLARDAGFADVSIAFDLAGKPRVLTGRQPERCRENGLRDAVS